MLFHKLKDNDNCLTKDQDDGKKQEKNSELCFEKLSLVYLYLFKLSYFTIEEKDRTFIENEIKISPQLPDRLYEIYNVIYPNSLDQGQLNYFIDRDIKDTKNPTECPCRLVAYDFLWTSQYNLSLLQMTFFIQSFASQKDCLNYYARKFEFDKNTVGINNIAIKLYGKEIEKLNDIEFIELIIIMENKYLYNNHYRMNLEKRINDYLDKI